MKKEIFKNKEELSLYFGDLLVKLANEKDVLNIALSGGSTPQTIFDVLAKEYKDKIDWNKINFYWGDERIVPPTDAESNYRMTKEHLFDKLPIKDENIFRVKGELSPEEANADYINIIKENIPSKNEVPVFDLMILGMGDDGHTASIFPHEMQLWDSENICEVATHPISGQKRVTLTGGVINNSEQIIFLVTGSNKAEKVKEIFEKSGDHKTYPAFRVDSAKTLWLMDEEAISLLK